MQSVLIYFIINNLNRVDKSIILYVGLFHTCVHGLVVIYYFCFIFSPQFMHQLFEEVDQDGSGSIDKGEFRMMLRKLNLTYSDHRFNLLFRAVDCIGGDGVLEEEELINFMFPVDN